MLVFSYASTAQNLLQPAYMPERSELLKQTLKQAQGDKKGNYQPRTEHLREDGSPMYTNRLILEDSPYLLQHAHNPVDWYAWGAEAFEAAKRENKPIFLSIGYSTCHWCHVMEKESFENQAIASVINQHFIAIKVDRERRPDVDKTYMNAVMLLTGRGGWPMSSFLTSDGKPFFGGTYYPPRVFKKLLLRVAEVWSQQREQLLVEGERLSVAVSQLTSHRAAAGLLGEDAILQASVDILSMHDPINGGFGPAPKFPQESQLLFLLNEAERNNNKMALEALRVTLDAMSRGGIYDQVGGGFHRYSTDNHWLVPHFEKMLYNQAHLGRVYLRAWRLTGDPLYQRIATQTFDYVLRDMTSSEGAFYSATDADSEGEEGTYFLWSTDQIINTLSTADAKLAIDLFGVTDKGNFEGSNILHLPVSLDDYAEHYNLTISDLLTRLDKVRQQLYLSRESRELPLRDEKILTAWNGMMISTLAQAGVLLNEPRYTNAAIRAAQFVWDNNRKAAGVLWRVHLDGSSSVIGKQQDYAYFAESLLQLYDATSDEKWLHRARELADSMQVRFWDEQNGGFYMSEAREQMTSMGRPKDGGTDNAIPSGNSVALRVLQMLNRRVKNLEYENFANATLAAFTEGVKQNPSAYSYMLTAAGDMQQGQLNSYRYVARGGVRASARQTGDQQVKVDIAIPPGWHINSNKPLQDGLIPTSISIAGKPQTQWQISKIIYPQAATATLGFQQQALSLYQGKVQIQLQVDSKNASSRILPLSLGIQACNDRICLPPEKVALHVPMSQIILEH